jgi:hypothetical protein
MPWEVPLQQFNKVSKGRFEHVFVVPVGTTQTSPKQYTSARSYQVNETSTRLFRGVTHNKIGRCLKTDNMYLPRRLQDTRIVEVLAERRG